MKQKERVKLHEPSIQLAPTLRTSSFTPQTPCHTPQRPSHHHLTQPPSFTPCPMAWKKSLSSKTPPPMTHCKSPPSLTLDPPPILIPQIPYHFPAHLYSNRHTLLHQPDHGFLVIQKAQTRKEGPLWFALSRRIQLCLRTGSPDLLLLCLSLVLENHPWGRGTFGEVIHCLGTIGSSDWLGVGSLGIRRALRFTL